MAADKNMLEGITTAWQSSVGWDGYAAKALDGDHSGNYGDGHCTHTSRFSLLPLMEYLFMSLWWVPACTAYSQKKVSVECAILIKKCSIFSTTLKIKSVPLLENGCF